jgi:hypothetical protein
MLFTPFVWINNVHIYVNAIAFSQKSKEPAGLFYEILKGTGSSFHSRLLPEKLIPCLLP